MTEKRKISKVIKKKEPFYRDTKAEVRIDFLSEIMQVEDNG
jgi:hypothetical protein